MSRALVTGATGFVGANLTATLASRGEEVAALARPGSDTWRWADGAAKKIAFFQADLLDSEALLAVLENFRPRVVYHLAAYGAYPRQSDPAACLEVNLKGCHNLLAASRAAEVEVLVYAGSSGEYGFRDRPIRETDPLKPNSHYAVGKAAASLLLAYEATRSEAPSLRLARLFSVYGMLEDPHRLMPQLVYYGLQGRLPPALGDPESARDYLFVEDAVAGLVALANSDRVASGEAVNLGFGSQTRLREAVDLARERFGIAEEPRWGRHPKASWDARQWIADIGKAERSLDWRPLVSLKEGFGRLAEWVEAESVFRRYYRKALEGFR